MGVRLPLPLFCGVARATATMKNLIAKQVWFEIKFVRDSQRTSPTKPERVAEIGTYAQKVSLLLVGAKC